MLVSIPPLPIPLAIRRFCKLDLGKAIIISVVVLLSLAPPSMAAFLNDLTIFWALCGSYFLPGTRVQRALSARLFLHLFLYSMGAHYDPLFQAAYIHCDPSFGPEHTTNYASTISATQCRRPSAAQREAAAAKSARKTSVMGCWRLVVIDAHQCIWDGLGGWPTNWKMVGSAVVYDPAE